MAALFDDLPGAELRMVERAPLAEAVIAHIGQRPVEQLAQHVRIAGAQGVTALLFNSGSSISHSSVEKQMR